MYLPTFHHIWAAALLKVLMSEMFGVIPFTVTLKSTRGLCWLINFFSGHSGIFDCSPNLAQIQIYLSQLALVRILKSTSWVHWSANLVLLPAPGLNQYSIMPIQCHPHVHISTQILSTSPKTTVLPLLSLFPLTAASSQRPMTMPM